MKEKLQKLMKGEGLTPAGWPRSSESSLRESPTFSPDGTNRDSICCRRFSGGFRVSIRTGCCSIPNRCIEPKIRKALLQRAEQTLETAGLTSDCSGRSRNRDRTPPARSLHRHKRPRTTTNCRSKPIRFFKPSPAMTGIPSCALFWSMPITRLRP